jgi:RNA polymerase sigma-70 factor, ECF subfamily
MPGYAGQVGVVEDPKERSAAVQVNETTLAHLYTNYFPAIYQHCRRFLLSTANARDATQETFVRVIERGVVLAFEAGAVRYLYRVSTNVCLNILNKQKLYTRTAAALAMNPTCVRWNDFADREFVLAVLARCGEGGAQVAIMHYLEGMSQVEIAEALGITRKTVFNRMRKIARIATDLLPRDLPARGSPRLNRHPTALVARGESHRVAVRADPGPSAAAPLA